MIQTFTDIWTTLVEWFVTLFNTISGVFYTVVDGGLVELTFIGTCAVIMAGVALILLVFNLIRSFIPMRG